MAESYLANLLLQLVDKKKVSLDDKLSKWLPGIPRAKRGLAWQPHQPQPLDIVTSFLIRSSSRSTTPSPTRRGFPEEILTYAHLDRPLLYQPGTNWNYAHTNFVILGMALDKITGRR